eukprot:jgi/Hompol1/3430/HPOL_006548-RA
MATAGTLGALIGCIYKEPLSVFADAFLLTFRLFATPIEVLDELARQYEQLQSNPNSVPLPEQTPRQLPAVLMHRICSFVKKWLTQYPRDLCHPPALEKLFAFGRMISATSQKSYADSFMDAVTSAYAGTESPDTISLLSYERSRLLAITDMDELRDTIRSEYDVVNMSSKLIATNFTRRDWIMFKAIKPAEFIYYVAPDSVFDSISYSRESCTANLNLFIERFNQLSYWAATVVCSYDTVKQRALALGKLIRVAHICMTLGNFNTAMAIFSGLITTPVFRLKKTFAALPTATRAIYDKFEALFSFQGNYTAYRELESKSPYTIIPFMGLVIKDLSSINEIQPKILESGLINFEKHWELSRRITKIVEYQSCSQSFDMTDDSPANSIDGSQHEAEDAVVVDMSSSTSGTSSENVPSQRQSTAQS